MHCGTRLLGFVHCWTALALLGARTAYAADYHWAQGSYFYNGPNYGNPLPMTLGANDALYLDPTPVGQPDKVFDTCYPTTGNGPVVNYGLVSWGATPLYCQGASLQNEGLWLATADNALAYGDGWGARIWNTSSGTFRKSGGVGSTVFGFANQFNDELIFHNAGTLDAQIGTIYYQCAQAEFNTGTRFAGSGTHLIDAAIEARFDGQIHVDPASHVIFHGGLLKGGAESPPSQANLDGTVMWRGGLIGGNWYIAPGSGVELAPSSVAKELSLASLTNHAMITVGDDLYLSGSTLTNAGIIDFTGSHVAQYADGGASTLTNSATGTIRMSAEGTARITQSGYAALSFHNHGTLAALLPGSTIEYSTRDDRFYSGTVFTGPGAHRVAGAASFTGLVFCLADAKLRLDAGQEILYGNNAILRGPAHWSGGVFKGAWTVAPDATLDLIGSDQAGIDLMFRNGGVLNLHRSLLLGTTNFFNEALLDLRGDCGIGYTGNGAWPKMSNTGTLRKSGGAGVSRVGSEVSFPGNSGTIDVRTGRLTFSCSEFGGNAGTILVAGGATFASDRAISNHGTIQGSGTILAPTLSNSGMIAPGNSVGTLHVLGNFAQSTFGSVVFELGGTAPGGFDVLDIDGNVSFAGRLCVRLANGFIALPGDTFEVITFHMYVGSVVPQVVNQTPYPGLSFTGDFTTTPGLKLTANAQGGDANLDGQVDIADLGLLASHWQTAGNWLAGDFDHSGFVDITDLGILATHWQAGATSLPDALAQSRLAGAAVPEPQTALLWGAIAIGLTRRRGAGR